MGFIASRRMMLSGAGALILGACTVGSLAPGPSATSVVAGLPAADATLTAGPTTGGLATVLELRLSGADEAAGFDRDTVVEWTGRYVPILGTPSELFTITWRTSSAIECSARRLRLRGIAGTPSGQPPFSTFLIPGRLEGTLAASLAGGEKVAAEALFAPFGNAIWRDIAYTDGPQGLDGPMPGKAGQITIYLLSNLPSGANPDDNQLVWAATSMHMALEITAPLSLAERWPACVHVDICTTDPDQKLLDRITVPLYPQPIETGANVVVYRSDMHRPILFVDLKVDQAKHPRVTLVQAANGGTVAVAASLQQPPAALVELEHVKAPPPVRTVVEALAALHTPEEMTSKRLAATIKVLGRGVDSESGVPWEEIIALVNDQGQHFQVREELLKFVLDDGDAAARRRLLRALLDAPAPDRALDRTDLTTWDWSAGHRGGALQWLSERETEELEALQPEAGELLAIVAETPQWSSTAPYELLEKLPADDGWKSRMAARLIQLNGVRAGFAGETVVDLLQPAEIAAFRARIAEATLRPEGFPVQGFPSGIIDALADLGDREILPDLRRLGEGAHPNWQTRVEWWIRMIEMQADPRDLVAFATSTSEGTQTYRRLWALGRALELGVSKDDVRAAILAYAEAIRPQTEAARAGSLQREHLAAAKLAAYLLGEFKQFGLDRGVLREDDLPGVPLPVRIIGCG